MITTRRGFLKRASATLVALGVGIKPVKKSPFMQGGIVPNGPIKILTSGEAIIPVARGSIWMLDNFCIDRNQFVTPVVGRR